MKSKYVKCRDCKRSYEYFDINIRDFYCDCGLYLKDEENVIYHEISPLNKALI